MVTASPALILVQCEYKTHSNRAAQDGLELSQGGHTQGPPAGPGNTVSSAQTRAVPSGLLQRAQQSRAPNPETEAAYRVR